MKFIYFNCGTGVSLFPTELSSQLGAAHLWLRNIPADIDGKDMKWIYEFHLFELRITFYANDRSLLICTQLKQLREKKPKKNSGFNGVRAHDLCDTVPVNGEDMKWIYEIPVSQRSLVRTPLKPEYFLGFFPQLLKLITLLRWSIICLKSWELLNSPLLMGGDREAGYGKIGEGGGLGGGRKEGRSGIPQMRKGNWGKLRSISQLSVVFAIEMVHRGRMRQNWFHTK